MNPSLLSGLAWFLLSLLLFLLVQRWLHRELQAIFLLLTRHPELSVGLFSLVFFPGVFLHETSHFLMAKIVRVRTGAVSFMPRVLPNGTLRMGYVETASTDFLRDALIGTAPLLTGAVVIALLGMNRLGFLPLAEMVVSGQWSEFWRSLPTVVSQPDFWLWFYLAFAVSSTMLPSSSDRRAWLPVAIGTGFVIFLVALSGAGPWMLVHFGPALERFLRALAMVFSISLVLHLVLVLPAWPMRALICQVTGLRIA